METKKQYEIILYAYTHNERTIISANAELKATEQSEYWREIEYFKFNVIDTSDEAFKKLFTKAEQWESSSKIIFRRANELAQKYGIPLKIGEVE